MDTPRNDNELAEALLALRPTPRPEFAAALDSRAASGFPRSGPHPGAAFSRLVDRVRATPPRRVLAPAGAVAVAAIVVSTAVIATSEKSGTTTDNVARLDQPRSTYAEEVQQARQGDASAPEMSTTEAATPGSGASSGSGVVQFSNELPASEAGGETGPYASQAHGREVERAAQIVLGAEPSEVRDDAAQVFEAVHAADGIVLNSSIRDGAAGQAGARFALLIPAAKLSDAMASFSSIADVVSRHESTDDITAPTVGVTERLQDSNARVHGLLEQLAAADSDGEREAVEAELRSERNHQAALRSRLSDLDRRANLSHVTLRIETGNHSAEEGSGGPWGIGDAFDDAGRILAIAAGVAVIGLAILAPFALIALLAWLARGAYVRRARQAALGR